MDALVFCQMLGRRRDEVLASLPPGLLAELREVEEAIGWAQELAATWGPEAPVTPSPRLLAILNRTAAEPRAGPADIVDRPCGAIEPPY